MVNRVKNIFEEMRLLREQKQEFGEIDIKPHALDPLARDATRSMLKDAGMDIDNPDHVQAFLFMIVGHLYHDMKPGAMASFPVDKDELVLMAHGIVKSRLKPPNWSDIARRLQKDERLTGHLTRTMSKMLENRPVSPSDAEASGIDQALNALQALKADRKSIPL
jgi:hypothetical protein